MRGSIDWKRKKSPLGCLSGGLKDVYEYVKKKKNHVVRVDQKVNRSYLSTTSFFKGNAQAKKLSFLGFRPFSGRSKWSKAWVTGQRRA